MSWARPWLPGLLLASLCACQHQPARHAPAAIEAIAAATVASEPAVADAPGDRVPAYTWLPLAREPLTRPDQVLDHLRRHLIEPGCRISPRIQYWQGRYAASPQRFARQITHIMPLMALVLDELERYQLPAEYALLPIAESWYRPGARGSGDHAGPWQIGRSTAATLGLPVGPHYDARMDPVASTDAALRYLATLHNRFGDWRLATAAYNAGPWRLHKLLATADDGGSFSHRRRQPAGLPDTTFEHLAKIEALACLLAEPQRFGIAFTEAATLDPLVAIQLGPGQSSLAAIAAREKIPADPLIQLNPAFRSGFIAADAPRQLLVPASLAPMLDATDPPFVPSPRTEPIPAHKAHVVQSGDTLGAIARRHGIALRKLLELNGLSARSIIRPGQRIRLAP